MIEEATITEKAPPAAGDAPMPKISGYALLREKGRGPKAVVYKARRLFENDVVAVKLFHRGVCDRPMAEKLEAAIEKTAPLNHAGLIRSIGFGSDGGRSFLVMEYVSGESLANFLFRRQQFPPAKALSVVLHCAQTLKHAADQGFTHGRLHPGRIVLGRNNVRIAGVGMGERPEHASWSVQFPHLFEPLVYTPPEAMPSKSFPEKYAQAIDMYALGGILFHLLTCLPPYSGNDEGSIEAERARLKSPIAWPAGARNAYPYDLGDLIDAMLDKDPARRPTYEKLILKLSTLQALLQKSNAPGWDGAATVAKTADDASGKTSTAKLPDDPKTAAAKPAAQSSAAALIPTVPHVSAEKRPGSAPKLASQRRPGYRVRRTGFDVALSTLLYCMTVVVFLCAAYVTAQPYLPEKYRFVTRFAPNPATPTNPVPAPKAAATTKGAESKLASPDPVNLEEAALALRQLDKIQEMLRNSDIVPSNGLAKVLRGISDRAGRATPTGIRALILAGEIETKLQPGKALEPLPQLPVAPTPAPTPAPAPAVAKVETPPPPAPEPVKAAPPAKPIPGATAVVKQTRLLLKYFGYVKAKEALEQFAAKGDSDQKKIASSMKVLVNYEEGLYERTRAKLLDHIKKDPKHESLLQLFPRKDDPVGDDIIDFDEKGLHILVRGGPNQGVKITSWDKITAAQLLNLLLPLTTKNSLEDQLGLAVFAYNRGLAAEGEDILSKAEKIAPDGKEKAATIADTVAKITRALESPE